jgi:hypothetical protein
VTHSFLFSELIFCVAFTANAFVLEFSSLEPRTLFLAERTLVHSLSDPVLLSHSVTTIISLACSLNTTSGQKFLRFAVACL